MFYSKLLLKMQTEMLLTMNRVVGWKQHLVEYVLHRRDEKTVETLKNQNLSCENNFSVAFSGEVKRKTENISFRSPSNPT